MNNTDYEDDNEIPYNKDANRYVTSIAVIISIGVTLAKNSLVGSIWICLTFIFFPILYTALRFIMSDCINKALIFDRNFYDDDIMRFDDSEKNCYVKEFLEEMNQRANFWITIISMAIAMFCWSLQ